mmetsp:Transcript_57760/g.126470  ORF Transcript_57760/g.126470 Transcript_57760/m.126470 type:complete len:212 (-) Transcript_57760:8-643(-)
MVIFSKISPPRSKNRSRGPRPGSSFRSASKCNPLRNGEGDKEDDGVEEEEVSGLVSFLAKRGMDTVSTRVMRGASSIWTCGRSLGAAAAAAASKPLRASCKEGIAGFGGASTLFSISQAASSKAMGSTPALAKRDPTAGERLRAGLFRERSFSEGEGRRRGDRLLRSRWRRRDATLRERPRRSRRSRRSRERSREPSECLILCRAFLWPIR